MSVFILYKIYYHSLKGTTVVTNFTLEVLRTFKILIYLLIILNNGWEKKTLLFNHGAVLIKHPNVFVVSIKELYRVELIRLFLKEYSRDSYVEHYIKAFPQ